MQRPRKRVDPFEIYMATVYPDQYKDVLGKKWTSVRHTNAQQRCWICFEPLAVVVLTLPTKQNLPASWHLMSAQMNLKGAGLTSLRRVVELVMEDG